MKTKVKFLIPKDSDQELFLMEVFAYFPQLNYCKPLYGNTQKIIYAHIGQHSACHIDYLKECRKATELEYQQLKQELERIGYTLSICK